MTIILLLFFIFIIFGINAIRNRKYTIPNDVFIHEWGVSMVDGGELIKKEEKKESK